MIGADEHNVPGFHAERLSEYGEGGLYPISINDKFQNGRYEILNKLGHGSIATVWAAQDHCEHTTVSIKIIKARYSENNTELRILQHLQVQNVQGQTRSNGSQYLPQLLDHFYVGSPGKRNLFLVTELLGPSLSELWYEMPEHRLRCSSKTAKQLLLAVEYLHQHGIVHGDIHEENILFRIPEYYEREFDHVVDGEVRRKDGLPLEAGIPKRLVEAHKFELEELTDEELDEFDTIQLIDFSSSFFESDPPVTTRTLTRMCPPELIFQKPLGTSMDIWSLGCMTYQLVTGRALFFAIGERRTLIPQIHRVIGSSSADWLLSALTDAICHTWVDLPSPFSDRDRQTLEEMLQESKAITDEKSAEAFISFLRSALVIDPSERATAVELLAERWMQLESAVEEQEEAEAEIA